VDPGERDCAGVVIHDGHPYSMPPEAIGLPKVVYPRDRVLSLPGASVRSTRKFQLSAWPVTRLHSQHRRGRMTTHLTSRRSAEKWLVTSSRSEAVEITGRVL